MTDVACFASTAALPPATITSTLSRTNSAAISANRPVRPSAQRYSIARLRPSIQPSSRSRCTKAAVHGPQADAVVVPRNPMVGTFPACCARAASGHAAAAPPSSVMNARRFMFALIRAPRSTPIRETEHYGTCRRRAASFRLDAGELDDLGPFLGFFGNEFGEVGSRTAKHSTAQIGNSLLHFGIDQGFIDFLVELVDDPSRRTVRRSDAEPGAGLELRQEVSDSWNVWQHVRPRRGRNRQCS